MLSMRSCDLWSINTLVLSIRELHEACRQLVDLDMRQANAVAARQELDLRIGAAFTRFQTLTLRQLSDLSGKVISYGESRVTVSQPGRFLV